MSQLGSTTYSNYFNFDVIAASPPVIFSVTANAPLPNATYSVGALVPFSAVIQNSNPAEPLSFQIYASDQAAGNYSSVFQSTITAGPSGTPFSTTLAIPANASGAYWLFFAVTNSAVPATTVTTSPSQLTILLACGNNTCEAPSETCATCPADCNVCSSTNPDPGTDPPGNISGGGGGGGGGGGSGSQSAAGIGGNLDGGNANETTGAGPSSRDELSPEIIKQNPVLSLLNDLGVNVVAALSADATNSYTSNVIAGVVVVIVLVAAAAYFFGLL